MPFREIKQNLRIKTFVGNTENAVLIQIYTDYDRVSAIGISEISEPVQLIHTAALPTHTTQPVTWIPGHTWRDFEKV